ncbi:hypothetical protein [Enterobacter hormaechei]|nr:hypothetical protein [Enterobacter hormaechei]
MERHQTSTKVPDHERDVLAWKTMVFAADDGCVHGPLKLGLGDEPW